MERLYVRDAMLVLRYKKRESFNRWCRLNSVQIYSNIGSNKHYVKKNEFDEGLARNPIKHLPELFIVKTQPEKFNSYMKLTSELRSFKDQKNKSEALNGNGYIPSFDNEKRVLSTLLAVIGGS